MKRIGQEIFFFLMVVGVHQTCAFSGKTFLSYRSQTTDYPRFLAGWPFTRWFDFQERENNEKISYFFEVIPAYTATFQPKKISNYLFGRDEVNVSGSMSGDMSSNRILADYFGLPSDYLSTLRFCPTIQNFLVDFYWQADFGCLMPGLTFAVHAPLVYSKWNLKMCETVLNPGTNFYPGGYLSPADLDRSQLVATASSFFAGGQTFGDMQAPLKYGLICGEQHMMHLSDLQAFLQWQISACDERTLSLEIFGSAPTGNRPEAIYFFEPLVGNGKHWEFGVGAFGTVKWCANEKYNSASLLYWQFLISHLFPACQKRSFDFCANGPGSRYMLLEEIRTPVYGLLVNGVAPANQYQGRLSTAINHTTFPCSISVPVQIDLLVKINSRICAFDVEVGYNLWFRSAEQLNWRKKFREDKYGIKGDAQIYGFVDTRSPLTGPSIPVPLNATESNATLCGGQGVGNFVAGSQYQNNNVDNPALAQSCAAFNLLPVSPADLPLVGYDPATLDIPINSSNAAILLTDTDINDCSALSSNSLSHTFFAHLGYSGKENCNGWIPYIGIGAEIEYACFCFSKNSAVSQWGAWLKAGVSY